MEDNEDEIIGDPQMMELPGGHMMAMQALVVDGRNVVRVSTTNGEHRDLTMVELADLMNDMANEWCTPRGDHEGARKLREAADHMLNSRD